MNTILLKSQIVLNNKRIPDVAKELRISKSAFYRKLRGDTEFTRQEISKMIDYLNLSVDIAMDIFFNEKVS
ncbi:TetR family transcriptional regulator [Clostridium sporogenes]|nr:TetR family transcriptional regulator [Clostridium sporogenes]MBZ1328018.1 XRE family transcriptional regulator [Clostridium botulinum]KRU24107.1 TetR family transcriptional regulator [Clostridium sporogenes]KRU28839.1 BetR family transcriptional regulator [Clostridium sporogenes]KRU35752.1 TetR family transcriptional regulator [Clostridium sporogenes]